MSTTQYVIGSAILIGTMLLKILIIVRGQSSNWRISVGVALLFFISGAVLWGSYGNWVPFLFGVMEIVGLFVSRAREARRAVAK